MQRQLAEAEERAAAAQRDLLLARDALRVQADLAIAAGESAAAATAVSISPGKTSRFPASNHDLPLASSPVLRAPPPLRWGYGSIPVGGVGAGAGGNGPAEGKGKGGGGGGDIGSGGGTAEGGGGESGLDVVGALVGRTQEMGVRFALDTLKYSENEEVVVFMLQLVQVGGLLGCWLFFFLFFPGLTACGRVSNGCGNVAIRRRNFVLKNGCVWRSP